MKNLIRIQKKNKFTNDLLECFTYHSDGQLYWTSRSRPYQKYKFKPAGSINKNGYRYISVFNKKYLAHHLVWYFNHFKFPNLDIDHINGNRSDNRIENLRELPRHLNLANSNLSKGKLPRGVIKNGKGYMARIKFKNKSYYIKTFKTVEEAHMAYLKKRCELVKIEIVGAK